MDSVCSVKFSAVTLFEVCATGPGPNPKVFLEENAAFQDYFDRKRDTEENLIDYADCPTPRKKNQCFSVLKTAFSVPNQRYFVLNE
ncbi:MAG: hypothetical protein D4R77_14600 [Planctomycetaceae bacterium]|nr:MAG: hypothetical protein D4R77_14600 [Planctomycetaceae bacterium]